MKKTLFTLCTLAMVGTSASADITVKFDFTPEQKEVIISSLPIEQLLTARHESDITMTADTIAIINGKANVALKDDCARQYIITINGREQALTEFFAAPDENISIKISGSQNDMKSNVGGTPLLDGINTIKTAAEPLKNTILSIRKGENTTDSFEETLMKYYGVFEQFVRENPDHEATAYAMLNVDQNVFMELYDTLGEKTKNSLYFPFVESSKMRIEQQLEAERRQAEMQSGSVDAPDFTLPGLNGEKISLSDFRGKWVVIDFWAAGAVGVLKVSQR